MTAWTLFCRNAQLRQEPLGFWRKSTVKSGKHAGEANGEPDSHLIEGVVVFYREPTGQRADWAGADVEQQPW